MAQNTKTLEQLPIDIHYNKLLDWLVNRRHCTQQCQAILTVIRDKTVKAKEDSLAENLGSKRVKELLDLPQLNYFQIKEIFDTLKETSLGKKNLIGQFTNQSMKNWYEILKLYEKDGTYLAESALLLLRNVTFEVPALKKQITKCQQTKKDCLRKEKEFSSGASDLKRQYAQSCKQLGIKGDKIKTELSFLIKDLPSELSKFAENARSLDTAVKFYDDFTSFLLNDESVVEENLQLLKHLLLKGNTTTFEWRNGVVPSRVDMQEISIDISDEKEDHNEDSSVEIDWGGADDPEIIDYSELIDFDIGEITVEGGGELAVGSNAQLENPDIDEIDWGAADNLVNEKSQTNASEMPNVASGKDALSLIDNPETRNAFVDDLLELQAFLRQRSNELSHDDSQGSHMMTAPSSVHVDGSKIDVMLTQVKDILDKLTSVQMQHLLLIRDSPRYVDRLRDSLKQKLTLSEKMSFNQREMAGRRAEAESEEMELNPQLEALKKYTKSIQKQLEVEISKKYSDRKVNIMGEINML